MGIFSSNRNSPCFRYLADISTGRRIVQVIHQTAREFFLDPNGVDPNFWIRETQAHTCVAITCARYLALCTSNTSLAGRLPAIEHWKSEHHKIYAQYLNERPLALYALWNVKHHIDSGETCDEVERAISQFTEKSTHGPVVFF